MVLLFTMTHLMCHVKEAPRNAYPTIRVVPDGSFGRGGKESVAEINIFYVTSHLLGRLSLAAEHLPRV